MTEQHPMVAKLIEAIEQAARKSIPWPEQRIEDPNDDENWEGIPQTLGHFVAGTYIGEEGASEVFRAAAVAAARAALTALLEPTPDMVEAGDEALEGATPFTPYPGPRISFRAMIQHVLTGSDQSPEGLDAHAARSRSNPSADLQRAGQTTTPSITGE